MATKKEAPKGGKGKKTPKSGKEELSPIEVIIQPDAGLHTERIYANYVDVIHSPFDFTLRFCDMPPIRDFDEHKKNQGKLQVPIVSEIAIPAKLVPDLIGALEKQLVVFEDAYGGTNGRGSKSK